MKTNRLVPIEPAGYGRVRPLFASLEAMHLNVTAVLDGACPGEVWADGAVEPRTACLSSADGLYLAGDPANLGFAAALNAELPRDSYFVLFYEAGPWDGALEAILEGTYAVRAPRHYYRLAGAPVADWQDRLPPGFVMRPVDARLLAEDLENLDDAEGWILECWPGVERFLEEGFGSCLVSGHEIVSWSLVDYRHGGRCEIGIRTAARHRRHGFGTLVTAATAAQAAERGITEVGWHCWANNAGSIGVAHNVGFRLETPYDVYINHWPAENVSDMSAAEYVAFARAYERAFEAQPPKSGYPHLVAASAWALGGDREACFRQLHRAVDVGWLHSEDHLREVWPEFFWNPNLDDWPEWQALRERLGKASAVCGNQTPPDAE